MDIRIAIEVADWECQEDIHWGIVDMLHDTGIDREVRAYDNEMFILDSNYYEMEIIDEWATAYLGG